MRSNKKRFRRRSQATGSVDVHCHVFNSHDIPVRRFVELVYLEKYPGAVLAVPLIDFIEFIMRAGAPTTREEIDELTQSGLKLRRLKPHGTRANNIRAVSQALKIMWLRSPQDRQWVRRHLSPRLRRHFRGQRRIAMTPAQFKETARYLIATDDIGTWINFALIYTKARWEITQELAALSRSQAADVFLYTPAMLDIGTRLGEPDTSDLSEQVEVMRLISQIKGRSFAVHAFAAFDPFRAIDNPDALAVVKDAIRNQGAIGVKIYPPMGFKPCLNSNSLGVKQQLDQQMGKLLKFCLDEDVPILAHCSFSQYVSLHPEDGACAAPEAWRAFLQQPGHKKLRLDLGHCGGPWDFKPNSETKTVWTKTVISLLGSDTYPNLYADVSDDSWILEPDSVNNRKLMNRLAGFLQNNPKARGRLLYGSDWSLLARESGANNYFASMKTHFCDRLNFTAAERRGYLGGNALRFLGLAKNSDGSKPQNRRRLETFRGDSRLDMSIFSKIDAIAV
jgi:predicted TIM-barrel fold metal-dependent hydrolase